MFDYHQLFALKLGIENVRGFFVAYACCAIVARTLLGGLGDRFGRQRVAGFTLVFYAASVGSASVFWVAGGLVSLACLLILTDAAKRSGEAHLDPMLAGCHVAVRE